MKLHPAITPKIAAWIAQQRVFFVGTAPLAADGHVNLSPKGGDSFRVLGPLEAAYLDYTGSGAETIAHLRENQRIVLMFCAFAGPPQILRLHGRGEAILPEDSRFPLLATSFPNHTGARAIIRVDVSRVADSCGYAVPNYEFLGHRDTLDKWSDQKGPDGIRRYQSEKNRRSIDGLPSIDP